MSGLHPADAQPADLAASGGAARPAPRAGAVAAGLVRVLRPHQWVKNLLLFLPLVLAHVTPWDAAAGGGAKWLTAAGTFVAFCLCASAVYVLNDLLDVAADRAHPTKRRRPFASGDLPTAYGPPLLAGLVAATAVACVWLPRAFVLLLGLYVALTTAYSLHLKRRVLVDVFVLAGLYTLRILAGGAAVDVPVSKWLMAFSIFLFVSLAFAKRYTELVRAEDRGDRSAAGRGYQVEDLRVIEAVGPASGYMAVMVLALYINDASGTSAAGRLYPSAALLWLLCPLLMYWVTRVWFFARRRQLDDDPILFAIRDKVSWAAAALAAVVVVAASRDWSAVLR